MRPGIFAGLGLGLGLALLGGTARAELLAPTLPFERYVLPNGLTVVLSEDHHLPLTAVDLWYHVGASNEVLGRSGFAHLFEHLMFQGSKHIVGDEHVVFGILESMGATTLNGTTDFDRTNYFETVPANQLETALWLESDRMGFLLEAVDQKKLDIQREVVLNEKRQGDNQPYNRAEERLYQLLFPQPHPYFGAVIGLEEDLKAAKLDDVKAFFRTYYAPNNATLVLSGDFQPAAAKALVEKYFGPIARAPEKPRLAVKPTPVTAEKRESMADQVHLPKLLMAWRMPVIFGPGDADAHLIATVLGQGKSSRLYQQLVYEKQLAQDVSVQLNALQLGSVLEIGVVARPGKTMAEVEAALQAELDALRAAPITAPELERARTQVVAGMVRSVERLGGFGGKADILALYDTFLQNPGYLPNDFARLMAVTPASIQAQARSSLGNQQRVVITVLPAEAAPAATPAAPVTK